MLSAFASESDAVAASANIQPRHTPFITILDLFYASATSAQIVGSTRCGDSALWRGAYLAAESFRYSVTSSPNAASNVLKGFAGLKSLLDVRGGDSLARCILAREFAIRNGHRERGIL